MLRVYSEAKRAKSAPGNLAGGVRLLACRPQRNYFTTMPRQSLKHIEQRSRPGADIQRIIVVKEGDFHSSTLAVQRRWNYFPSSPVCGLTSNSTTVGFFTV